MRGDLLALAYRVGEVVEQSADEEWMTLTIVPDRREWERSGYPLAPLIIH
jgi:hypothetical protein